MDAGTEVYFAYVGNTIHELGGVMHFIEPATMTGIEINGRPQVRIGTTLHPASLCHASKSDAMRVCLAKLVSMAGVLQRQIDELRDQLLHADLTTEEAAA